MRLSMSRCTDSSRPNKRNKGKGKSKSERKQESATFQLHGPPVRTYPGQHASPGGHAPRTSASAGPSTSGSVRRGPDEKMHRRFRQDGSAPAACVVAVWCPSLLLGEL